MAFGPGGGQGTTSSTTTTPAPSSTINNRGYVPGQGSTWSSPLGTTNLENTIQYIYGGGNAVAGGGSDGAIVYTVDEQGNRKALIDPGTGNPVRFGDNANVWANIEAWLSQTGGLPWDGSGVNGGGGGGYGYGGGGGGGGGGEIKAYPQFDYNRAQGTWNDYITRNGFGQQDRRGDWARNYYNQSLLEFNTDWANAHPAQEIPKEGTTELPDVAQNTDYNAYLSKAFGTDSLSDIYASLSGSRRGDQYSRYAGNGRTLSWG